MDPEKVRAILEWKSPRTVREVRSFIGFANFYRSFIPGFSRLAKPLIDLTQKDTYFRWTPECEWSFNLLKSMFVTGPILAPFRHNCTTVLENGFFGL